MLRRGVSEQERDGNRMVVERGSSLSNTERTCGVFSSHAGACAGGISFQMGLGMLRVTQTGGDARLSKASHEVLCLHLWCQGHSWSYVARNA